MKPLSLKLKGIFSYREEQYIDFEKLSAAGLFGIFGQVGSGKSTILDAISFVLFSSVDRLSKNAYKYDLLNLASDELFIELIFESSNRYYKVSHSYKRKKKQFKNTDPGTHSLYLLDERYQEVESLDPASISEVIGLSYDDFKRSMIIPQGKFSEFLFLKNAERSSMLQNLFSLHQYDLSGKVKRLKEKNALNLAEVEGALSQLPEQKEGYLGEKEKALGQVKATLVECEKIFNELVQKLTDLQQKSRIEEEYQEKLKQLDSFKNEKTNLSKKIEEVRVLERLAGIESELRRVMELKEQLQVKQQGLQLAKTSLAEEEEKLRVVGEKKANIEQQKTAISLKERQIPVLENRRLERALVRDVQRVDEKLKQTSKRREKIVSEKNLLEKNINEVEEQVKALLAKRPEKGPLNRAGQWHKEYQLLELELKNTDNHLTETQSEMAKLNRVLSEKLDGIALKPEMKMEFDQAEVLQNELEAKAEMESSKVKEIKNDLWLVRESSLFDQHREHLQKGEPCPLCGALEHPWQSANAKENRNGEASSLEEELAQSEARLLLLQNVSRFTQDSRESYQSFEAKHKKIKTEKSNIVSKIDHLQNTADFPDDWKDPERYEQVQNLQEKLEADVEALNTRLEKLSSEGKKGREIFDTLEKELHQLELEKKALDAEVKTYSRDFHLLENELLSLDVIQIESLQEKRDLEIKNYYRDKEYYEELHYKLKASCQGWKEKQRSLEEEATTIKEKLSTLSARNHDYLSQNELPKAEEEIKSLLLRLDTLADQKKEIDEFNKAMNTIRSQVQMLEEKRYIKGNLAQELERINVERQKREEEISVLREKQFTLQRDIKEWKEAERKRQSLVKNSQHLLQRKENLETLAKLFQGKAFVNYISSIYMKELTANANKRFSPLSNHHLQLMLDDDNQLMVQDALNGGHQRSVKTLSGGQTFQASLCLALALSDSIRRFTNTQSDFFFLDEGFGTLDAEQLDLVLRSLFDLRKEGRIVGVISHVESLQEEIHSFIKVHKSAERGSWLEAHHV